MANEGLFYKLLLWREKSTQEKNFFFFLEVVFFPDPPFFPRTISIFFLVVDHKPSNPHPLIISLLKKRKKTLSKIGAFLFGFVGFFVRFFVFPRHFG